MTRLLLAVALLPLAGCTIPLNTRAICTADPTQAYVGQVYDAAIGRRIKRLSQAYSVRTVRPGEMVTMEFNQHRVTVTLDERNRVSRISCG